MSEMSLLSAMIGERLWNQCFGADPSVLFDRCTVLDRAEADLPNGEAAVEATLCAEWYDCGLPRVVLGHRHAASLMSTTMRAVDVPDLLAPWSVFWLDVPTGMVDDPAGHPVGSLLVYDIIEPGLRTFGAIVLPANANHPMSSLRMSSNVGSLADANSDEPPAFQLLARYVVGVIAELTAYRPAQEASGRQATKRDPRGRPVTRTFQMTRNVRVDCRAGVKAFLSGGGGSAPNVQILVAGHWKKQAHGPARAERRWQHIEPYWRGPEDAPIALRAHTLAARP